MIRILSFIVAFAILPNTGTAAEYILRASIEQKFARVGVPFPLVLRFYYDDCCIRKPDFSTLEIPGADVLPPTTPEQYEEETDGTKFGVYELRFLIIPSRTGTLSIPKITMVGEIIEPTRAFSTPQDEVLPTMEVESEPLTILVRQ